MTMWLKSVDRWLSGPAAWVGRVGSAAFSFRSADPRPLILRPGGMGDLIFMTVAMEEMKLDPRAPLWLIEKRSEPWAKHAGLSYLCYDRSPLEVHLRIAARYRTVLNSEQRFGLAQATALLARAPFGRGKLFAFETNLAASQSDVSVPYDPLGTHETVAFSRMLHAALGGAQLTKRPERDRSRPASSPILIGIGGLQSETRKLTESQWLGFVEAFSRGEPVEIARAPVDAAFASSLASRLGPRAKVFEGGFSELCARIATAREVLTIDSGFQHMASYYGVPTVSIFTSSRSEKWAPISKGSRIVARADLSCQPCAMFAQVPACPHAYACREVDFLRHVKPA